MIVCCLNINPLESSELGIFMIVCCRNIKPLESSELGIFMINIIYDSMLPEYQAFSEHENIYDSVLPEYQAFREQEIFMIVCCLNINQAFRE